jgi:hypothetical protein
MSVSVIYLSKTSPKNPNTGSGKTLNLTHLPFLVTDKRADRGTETVGMTVPSSSFCLNTEKKNGFGNVEVLGAFAKQLRQYLPTSFLTPPQKTKPPQMQGCDL